jgi:glycogen synthase
MKIGIFTDTYYPRVDGIVTALLHFKKGLEKRGHEVYVVTPKHGKEKILRGIKDISKQRRLF